MTELFDQTIEKMTAAQIRGFESIDALKKKYKLEIYKDKPKNLVAELLKTVQDESDKLDPDLDPNGPLKEQILKRKSDQQEVLIRLFKTKIEFPQDDREILRSDRFPKFSIPILKKSKSVPMEIPLQRVASSQSINQDFVPRLEPAKTEKIKICENINVDSILTQKFNEIKDSINGYIENTIKIKENEINVHPMFEDFEKIKLAKYQELEVFLYIKNKKL